jgi:hypothetical protein
MRSRRRLGALSPLTVRSFGLVAMILLAANMAAAQEYRVDEPDLRLRSQFLAAKSYAENPAANAANQAVFKDYFSKYFFQAMTKTDPTSLGELSSARDNLFKVILWRMDDQQLQAELTTTTLNAVLPIIASRGGGPPYHPAVRYNAVLILGLLDSTYPNNSRAEVPLPEATRALTQIANYATTSDIFPPPVILGALIGLERHARLSASLSPQAIDAMTAAVLKIVNLDQPIQELGAEEFDWLRLRAGGVLANLGNVGPDNQCYNGLLHLVGSVKSLEDRCEAAGMLAKLKYGGAKIDGSATAQQLMKLAADVADAELARALKFENKSGAGGSIGRERPTGRERDSGNSGYDESFVTTNPDAYPRRPLVTNLEALRLAFTSTKPFVADDAKARFDEVLAAIGPVLQAAMDEETVELAVSSRVREMSSRLKRITAAAAPAAAPAGAAAGL